MKTTERPAYDTPQAALTAAVLALDTIDPRHEVTRVNFGQFADTTDRPGRFYFTIAVTYSVGNTVGDICDTAPSRDALCRRLDMVTRKYTEFVHEAAIKAERAALGVPAVTT